jgi:hypothetical protein
MGFASAVINGESYKMLLIQIEVRTRSLSGPSIVAGLPQVIESRVLGRAARLACIQSFSLHGLTATLRKIRVICIYFCFVTAMNTFKR